MNERYLNLSGAPWTDVEIENSTIVEPKDIGGEPAVFNNGDAYENTQERLVKILKFISFNKPSFDYIIVSNNELGREILDYLVPIYKVVTRERSVPGKHYWQKVTRLHFNPVLEK